ncbi:MAG TPA: hypothetical protein VJI32_06570 [Candidatus Nanoarchaeia archaeon]|nr:hypothetical protein [Candidatus Nanoarchaeia archaeon]
MTSSLLVPFPPERMRDFLSFMGYDPKEVRYIEFLKPKNIDRTPIPENIGTVVSFLEGIRKGEEKCDLGVRIWNSIDKYVQRQQPDYAGVITTHQQIMDLRLHPSDWHGPLYPTVVAFSDTYSIPKL